jgi:hypothetical protein
MVRTRSSENPILDIPEGSIGRGLGQVPCGGAPSPPPRPPISLEQLLATTESKFGLLLYIEYQKTLYAA